MLWWCTAHLIVGRASAVLGLPLAGACPGGEKSFENWYDLPRPALEPALHAQPVILYIAVPFSLPLGLTCADHLYIPVGGKAASVLLGASPCFLWEPRGAVLAWWCGVCARVRWPVAWARSPSSGLAVFCVLPCLAAPVVCASVPQCGRRTSGWFGLVASRPLAYRGGSLGPLPSSLPQMFCDLVPWCATFSEAMHIGASVTFVPQPPALGYNMLAGCVP